MSYMLYFYSLKLLHHILQFFLCCVAAFVVLSLVKLVL